MKNPEHECASMEKQIIRLPNFSNEPGLNFSDPEVEKTLSEAVREVRSALGDGYAIMTCGQNIITPSRLMARENPSNRTEIVGYVSMANESIADAAIAAMNESNQVKEWMEMTYEARGEYLRRTAEILRRKRFFFIALMIVEAGKNRWEADGEFCEAVDFLEYYAAYAPFLAKLNEAALIETPGHRNGAIYMPIGPGVSIQPWNFPLAISVGPTAAGLVMGNPMIYKPAEHTSITGFYLSKCFYEAGIPGEVFHFLPGYGEEIGAYIVRHPDVKLITFTGSKEVRRFIQSEVHRFNSEIIDTLSPRKRHEKVIAAAESGGKGTMIIDKNVDVEEAGQGVFDAAFGFQGQKCSAGTRVIVVGSIDRYSRLAQLLRDKIYRAQVGSPENKSNFIGPMISLEAAMKVERYKEAARLYGKILAHKVLDIYAIRSSDDRGYFVGPMLVGDVPMNSSIMQEEIFGPVLAMTQADNYEEALDMANDSEFGLTGGVYTHDDEHWKMAVENFEVGNLYRNRKITGAVVGQQPFGGYKMSGNSTKAGGWDYLLNFVRRKTLCVKI